MTIADVMKNTDKDGVLKARDVLAYASVVEQAFDVHIERDRIRMGQWKHAEAKDQFNMVKYKVDRVIHSLDAISMLKERCEEGDDMLIAELEANILKETPDLINYIIFGHRQVARTA